MTPLEDVIERLERATGPNDDLDRAVLEACGWRFEQDCGRRWIDPQGVRHVYDVCPTVSVDAALMLVPEKHHWRILHAGSHDGAYEATVFTPSFWAARENGDEADSGFVFARSNTPSIALCLAALRARLAQQTTEGE